VDTNKAPLRGAFFFHTTLRKSAVRTAPGSSDGIWTLR